MEIGGFQKYTLIDYPQKISSTVFVKDCNFRCPFCYNPELVFNKTPQISEEEIFSYLKQRKKFIDAVVICGGEPLLQKDLPEFCKKIKKLNFLIKIDTNGSQPEMLQTLIDNNLVDYIAMDIKTRLEEESYNKASGIKVDIKAIKKSIKLIRNQSKRNSYFDYEFRTTVVPTIIDEQDIITIAKELKGSKKYVLQQFINNKPMINQQFQNIKPYSKEVFEKFLKLVKPYFKEVELRA